MEHQNTLQVQNLTIVEQSAHVPRAIANNDCDVAGLLDHVTVLVGIAVGGRAVGGVIHQPYYNYKVASGDDVGRTLWGITGIGTGGFKAELPPEGKRIIATTRSHSDSVVQAALDALKPDEVLRVGGAGHKVRSQQAS
jgi:3'(2'), 5'-bisphosphate nucleotidase